MKDPNRRDLMKKNLEKSLKLSFKAKPGSRPVLRPWES
jgi:hypothetical protein